VDLSAETDDDETARAIAMSLGDAAAEGVADDGRCVPVCCFHKLPLVASVPVGYQRVSSVVNN
jgi:hypothetical protein